MKDLTNNNMSFNEFKEAVQLNNNELNYKINQVINNTPTIYTAVIDTEESHPDNAVIYKDASVALAPQDDEWYKTEIFKDIKPCLFNEGQVMCYLDPEDYNQQIKPVDDMGKPTYEPIFLRDDIIKAPSEKLYICQIEEDLSDNNAIELTNGVDWKRTDDGAEVFTYNGTEQFISNVKHLKFIKEGIEKTLYYFILPKATDVSKSAKYFAYEDGTFGPQEEQRIFYVVMAITEPNRWVQQTGGGFNKFGYTLDRGYDTTVCFKPHSNFMENTYIDCSFSDIDNTKEYYLEMRFYAKAYERDGALALEKRCIDLEIDGKRFTIDLPKKGKELSSLNLTEDSQYEFQVMRIYLGNISAKDYQVKIYKTPYSSIDNIPVKHPEIDYIALRSVDSVEQEQKNLSYTIPQNNVQGIKSTTISSWIVGTKSNDGMLYTAKKNIPPNIDNATDNPGYDNGRRITLATSSFVEFPSIALYPYVVLKGEIYKQESDDFTLDVNYNLKLKDGTISKFYAQTHPTLKNGKYEIVLDLTKLKLPGGVTYALDDIDIHSSIQSILLKPWQNNSEMTENDTFSINSITFCNNLEKTTEGGLFGEVMIEIPKMGYQFKNVNNTQEISITRENELPGFCYDAFRRGSNYNDYIYISAYEATKAEDEDRCHSLNRISDEGIKSDDNNFRIWTGLTNDWSILTYQTYTLLGALSLLYNKSISSTAYSKDTFLGIKDLIKTEHYHILEGLRIEDNKFYNKFNNYSNMSGWNLLSENVQSINSNSIPSLTYVTNNLGFFPKEGLGTTSTYYTMSIPYNPDHIGNLIIPANTGNILLTTRLTHEQCPQGRYCHIMYSQT